MKVEVVGFSKSPVHIYQITWRLSANCSGRGEVHSKIDHESPEGE